MRIVRRKPAKWLLLCAATGIVLVTGIKIHYVFFGSNAYTVVEGECYRSGQPSPLELTNWVEHYGVRTVINLRGPNPSHDWYKDQAETAKILGIKLIDVPFFSGQSMPNRPVFNKMVDAIGRAEPPLLIHCHTGANRTGLASAIYLLLHDRDMQVARGQLSIWYGHVSFARDSWKMDRVLDLYARWLDKQSLAHNAGAFRHWADKVYEPTDIAPLLRKRHPVHVAESQELPGKNQIRIVLVGWFGRQASEKPPELELRADSLVLAHFRADENCQEIRDTYQRTYGAEGAPIADCAFRVQAIISKSANRVRLVAHLPDGTVTLVNCPVNELSEGAEFH